jgi:hypothetical protein
VRTIQDLELVISSKRLPGVKCAVVMDVDYNEFGIHDLQIHCYGGMAPVTGLKRDPDVRELIEREIAAYEKAECLEGEE